MKIDESSLDTWCQDCGQHKIFQGIESDYESDHDGENYSNHIIYEIAPDDKQCTLCGGEVTENEPDKDFSKE